MDAYRKRNAPPKELQLFVFRRDGWLCRWCKRPVIFAPALKLLEREVKKSVQPRPLAYYHGHWTRDRAPLLDELGAVIDHVEAHSKGGPDTGENLATACNKCNGRKSASCLPDWEKRPKRKPIKGKYGEPQNWDGLSTLFLVLARRDPSTLTVTDRNWLRVLTQEGKP